MASSSNSSIHKSFKYDVFLNFRGEDTRSNFIDHLYYALQQKSIYTYKDDERIKKGERISDELLGSIEDSKFYSIVFSKNYASSSWCLDELLKIIECQKTTEHTAYPVFYDVEPSEVRKQSGAVGEAFAKHGNEEAAGKWREALKEAADLAGWELKNTADGEEDDVAPIPTSLRSGFDDDVGMIGIKGMGGGGKTTLARAVFDQISNQFQGKSFVENVREVSKASMSGLKSLQNQFLSDVLNEKGVRVSSVHDGKNMIKRVMRSRKVLVVLDDVDHIDQLEALAGESNWFKPGSAVIFTTRDEQVLVAHGVKLICNVKLLSDTEGICLFNRYAFGRVIPIERYTRLSKQVIRYAGGLPLTIRVLGSFLCGKNELEWMDAIERLKTIPLMKTMKKLELSYIGLEEDYKQIFLDVACLLQGEPKYLALEALESCGFYARNGLRVLEQRSLITIGDKHVGMHDHIRELGRNIVRRLHPDKPKKHSRLWIEEEIEDILANDLGTKATRCIRYSTHKINPEIRMIKGLRKMQALGFLDMFLGIFFWEFKDIILYLPDALRYLRWSLYPFKSLPKTFQPNNLVALSMPYSRIVQLWEGGERKVLNKLRFLNLDYSDLKTLDLELTPNLEKLTLEGCHILVELHMSVACLKLRSFYLSDSKLRTLDFRSTPNLEVLDLDICKDLVEVHMPDRCVNLRSLQLTNSKLRTLDLGLTPNLKDLCLTFCYDLEQLHMADDGCQKLASLTISHSKMRSLCLWLTPNLQYLNLNHCSLLERLTLLDTKIKHFPDSIYTLKHLKILQLISCELEKLPEDIDRLECLHDLLVTKCKHLRNLPNKICKMKRLKYLNLRYCIQVAKLPEGIGHLECLKELDIEGTSISYLPQSILLLKGVRIYGSRELLQLCGFTSEIQTSGCGFYCYVEV
ncbi:unnamed protein product [Lactuca virosa]|uniref:TIR domain-containing protein n=1 Tax=Lactuca virosa TaxID=75947 RepID=A0AAU9NWE6_9ASTR|nr:unnamed protein product [Lactuca virosa]